MAEFDKSLIRFTADGGVCEIIAICEDTQTTTTPESNEPSPIVVRTRLVNSTQRPSRGRWMHSNGDMVTGDTMPGENAEINIAANRRTYLHLFTYELAMGPKP
jgi:hypothetical protein